MSLQYVIHKQTKNELTAFSGRLSCQGDAYKIIMVKSFFHKVVTQIKWPKVSLQFDIFCTKYK